MGLSKESNRKRLESHGYIDAVRLLLNKCSTHEVSISPWLGRAVELAISNGHDDIVDILLSAGPILELILRNGESIILAAIWTKNAPIIRKLVSAGVRMNKGYEHCSRCATEHESNDVLIAAIKWGDYPVINSLLDIGASLHTLGHPSHGPSSEMCILPLTAAIMANDFILVNYLISAGAAINNPPESARTSLTPLSAAIRNRDLELVNALIYCGSNPYDLVVLVEATNEFTLLQALLTALHNFKEPSNSDGVGRVALCKAVEKQNHAMTRAILSSPLKDAKSIWGLSAGLHQALLFDSTPNFETIRMFLNLGADPNLALGTGTGTGTEYYSKTALWVAIGIGDLRKVELLLEAGARADKNPTWRYNSPMQFAISQKSPDILRKLLEHGSDPNTDFDWKGTPIQMATGQRALETVKVLLQYKGDPNATTSDFLRRPLELATENQDLDMIRLLLQNKADPNAVFGYRVHTPLQNASRLGGKEIVELLLEHGADVNAPPAKKFGATALQFAAIKGFLGIAHILLENGADVNAPPAESDGRTALEGASEHGRIDMVQLLLNAGASIFEDGQAQYENAVRRASENGHHALRRLLESYHG
jgi:ankyrin repeat protein